MGYYCLKNTSVPSLCPLNSGSYCPAGTSHYSDFLCPNGTFSSLSGLSNNLQCTSCSGGKYCNSSGLITPSGICNAGYYCGSGSLSAMPSNVGFTLKNNCVFSLLNVTNGLCPPGFKSNNIITYCILVLKVTSVLVIQYLLFLVLLELTLL